MIFFKMRTLSKQKNLFQRPPASSPNRHCTSAKYGGLRCFEQSDEWIKIGKYKILLDQVLGKGYSSCVYKGIQVGKQLKRYAIKVIQLKNFNATCLRLFQIEIEIHKSLDHQHIVKCYDVFRTETHIYMVMEYCPHGDLSNFIKNKKKIPEHMVVDIMSQILNGYNYLSNLKIIHRDLKPSNILRSGKIWKIADFGFSVRTQKGFTDNINVGTPMYMPVESLSRSFYSSKSDIFALGVILYQMTHGRPPWSSQSQVQLLRKMCNNKLKLEAVVNNQKIVEFIQKACEIEQESRLSQEDIKSFSFSDKSQINHDSPFMHSTNYSISQSTAMTYSLSSSSTCLLSQLSLCKFLQHMAENIECFLLPVQEKRNFLLLILKFMLKTIKSLEDGRFGAQKLANFDEYKASAQYSLIFEDICDYVIKYEKTYLDQIKATDIQTIRAINSIFPELTKATQMLDQNFYTKMKNYLQTLIKESTRRLNQIIDDDGEEQSLPQKLQAFQNMIVLQRLLQWRSKGQTFPAFTFPTLGNYSNSSLRKSDYLNMRKQMKYI